MDQKASPVITDVVLVGGGHANIQVMKMFAMQPIAGLRVTLVSDKIYAPYSGMLPGFLLGYYSFEQCHFDLAKICQAFGFRFVHARAEGVDAARKKVILHGRQEIAYDFASINIGIEPKSLENSAENVIPIKPISKFVDKWKTLIAGFEQRAGVSKVAVVGGGAAGVEMTLVLMQQAQKNNWNIEASLFQRSKHLVSEGDMGAHNKLLAALKGYGVKVNLGSEFSEPSKFDAVLLTNKAQAPSWLKSSGLEVDDEGFVKVDGNLRVLGCEDLFAAGDCIHFCPSPLKKSGVYAVRQGMTLAHNIRRVVLGQSGLQTFAPKKNVLSLLVAGPKKVLTHQDSGTLLSLLTPSLLWKLKNWIDLRFMQRFSSTDLEMPEPKQLLQADQWQQNTCGGCGSKVGASVLSSAFQKLGLTELKEDAAITTVSAEKLCLQTIDHFRSFISDPYVFAEIAVYHALSDIYAMGGEPKNIQVGLTLAPATEKIQREDVVQTMSGVLGGLEVTGVELVGGHTNEGAESALAISVQGEVSEENLLTKSKLRVGDSLVLTKPLGTGVILAAHMECKVPGRVLYKAIEQMRIANGKALPCLREFGVDNCTDVTGFGLAGHLNEMLAGEFGAKIEYASIPRMAGVQDLFAQGLRSSISHKNRAALTAEFSDSVTDDTHPLLFDPQTSGGLLFSLPADQAKGCVNALREAGYAQAAVIGEVCEPGLGIEIV